MARDGSFYTYIMAGESGALYVGVTNNLVVLVGQHKDGLIPGFTQKYKVTKLVWYEAFFWRESRVTGHESRVTALFSTDGTTASLRYLRVYGK